MMPLVIVRLVVTVIVLMVAQNAGSQELTVSAGLAGGQFDATNIDWYGYDSPENDLDIAQPGIAWSLDGSVPMSKRINIGLLLQYGEVKVGSWQWSEERPSGDPWRVKVYPTSGYHWYIAPRVRGYVPIGRVQLLGEFGIGMRAVHLDAARAYYRLSSMSGESWTRVDNLLAAAHVRAGIAVGPESGIRVLASGLLATQPITSNEDYCSSRWSIELGLVFPLGVSVGG